MPYSTPYIILTLIFLSFSAFQLGMPLEEKSRKYLNYILIIVYVLFFGFRGYIGWDWVNYDPFYKELIPIGSKMNKSDFDLGFVFFSRIVKYFFVDYSSFLLLNSIINVTLLYIFFKKNLPTKYISLAFCAFIAFNGFLLEVELMRNIKSTLLFLISINYIAQRKPLRYFALIILAISFHWSAIFYLPLYFFLHKKIPLGVYAFIFIIGTLIYLFQIEYITPVVKSAAMLLPEDISEKILNYLNASLFSRSYGFTFGFFERTIMSVLILLTYKTLVTEKKNILFVNSYLIYIILFLFFSEITIVLTRVAGNFGYAYWILIPLIIKYNLRNSKPVLAVLFALIIIGKIHILTNNVLYKYDSSLFADKKDYKERLIIYKKNYKQLE